MIRKLLYRFRRMVLVWRLDRLSRRLKVSHYFQNVDIRVWDEIDMTTKQLNKLDATEMSKGEAYVGIR